MLESTIYIVKGETITELVAVNLFPFVEELGEVNHHVTLRAVQLGCGSVLIIVAVVITEISDGNFTVSRFLAETSAELCKDHGDGTGIDVTSYVFRITDGFVKDNGSVNNLFIFHRNGTGCRVGRIGMVRRRNVAFPFIDGNLVAGTERNLHRHFRTGSRSYDGTVRGRCHRHGTGGCVRPVIRSDIHSHFLT